MVGVGLTGPSGVRWRYRSARPGRLTAPSGGVRTSFRGGLILPERVTPPAVGPGGVTRCGSVVVFSRG
ncbi:hypothetical protein ADL32_04215 [Streptomyces albidoflavus]|nr:hypothetical protein ADL32_04215 [Streptomyces albidoflavus]